MVPISGNLVLQISKSVTGIQALISKLRISGEPAAAELGEDEVWLNPLDADVYCNNGTETALHCAVRRREHTIAAKLLVAGANPNLVIYATENPSLDAMPQERLDEQFYFKVLRYFREGTKKPIKCRENEQFSWQLLQGVQQFVVILTPHFSRVWLTCRHTLKDLACFRAPPASSRRAGIGTWA